MSTATIIHQPDSSAISHTPYDAAFVERLKATIPTQAVALAHAFYGAVEDIPATPPKPTVFRSQTPYRTVFLTDDAPRELIPVVYKALAKLNHPDRGGDTRVMQEINEAYETICKAVTQ